MIRVVGDKGQTDVVALAALPARGQDLPEETRCSCWGAAIAKLIGYPILLNSQIWRRDGRECRQPAISPQADYLYTRTPATNGLGGP